MKARTGEIIFPLSAFLVVCLFRGHLSFAIKNPLEENYIFSFFLLKFRFSRIRVFTYE